MAEAPGSVVDSDLAQSRLMSDLRLFGKDRADGDDAPGNDVIALEDAGLDGHRRFAPVADEVADNVNGGGYGGLDRVAHLGIVPCVVLGLEFTVGQADRITWHGRALAEQSCRNPLTWINDPSRRFAADCHH